MMPHEAPGFEVIKQWFEIEDYTRGAIEVIEKAARNCYQSERKVVYENNNDSYEHTPQAFVKRLIKRGHLAMLEFADVTVNITTSIGVTHELVRHRVASFAQESTRYVDYSKTRMKFIQPVWMEDLSLACETTEGEIWEKSIVDSYRAYIDLRNASVSPQNASDLLPKALKTNIFIKANFREWMHIFELRDSMKAKPQMRDIMHKIHTKFHTLWSPVFDGKTVGVEAQKDAAVNS